MLDHVGDQQALTVLADALEDPVPKVRRNAAHALGCAACKPAWDGTLPGTAAGRLLRLAESDPACRPARQTTVRYLSSDTPHSMSDS